MLCVCGGRGVVVVVVVVVVGGRGEGLTFHHPQCQNTRSTYRPYPPASREPLSELFASRAFAQISFASPACRYLYRRLPFHPSQCYAHRSSQMQSGHELWSLREAGTADTERASVEPVPCMISTACPQVRCACDSNAKYSWYRQLGHNRRNKLERKVPRR